MWEDEVNKDCVEVRAQIPNRLTMRAINAFWEDVVLDLITHKIPNAVDIAGIRMCDKSRGGNSQYRLEIWTKIKSVQDPRIEDMNRHVRNVAEANGYRVDIKIANRQ